MADFTLIFYLLKLRAEQDKYKASIYASVSACFLLILPKNFLVSAFSDWIFFLIF